MATIVAFAQRKGGSGKTTSAFNIAGALGQLGRRTLVIDMDPQVTLSTLCSAPLDSDLPAVLRTDAPEFDLDAMLARFDRLWRNVLQK